MRDRRPSANANTLRDFGDPTELSVHVPYAEPIAHRHLAAYAAIVLRGEYTESSADGILKVGPGDVVVHPAFHKHANVFAASPVVVLNLILPMPVGLSLPCACLRLSELPCSTLDIIHRPRDSADAIAKILTSRRSLEQPPVDNDVVGFALQKLKEAQAPKIYSVAAETGVSTEHLVRSFRVRHGLSPGEYRAEHRFRHAIRALYEGESAADTACRSGYSDQSHMTRDFQKRTGITPRRLVRQLHSPPP